MIFQKMGSIVREVTTIGALWTQMNRSCSHSEIVEAEADFPARDPVLPTVAAETDEAIERAEGVGETGGNVARYRSTREGLDFKMVVRPGSENTFHIGRTRVSTPKQGVLEDYAGEFERAERESSSEDALEIAGCQVGGPGRPGEISLAQEGQTSIACGGAVNFQPSSGLNPVGCVVDVELLVEVGIGLGVFVGDPTSLRFGQTGEGKLS